MIPRISALILCVFLMAACAGQPATVAPTAAPAATATAEPTAEATAAPVEPTATAAAAAAAFPVTIDHKYGATTITAQPVRIITVGLTEQDALLALGVTPIATTEWFGGHPGALWPWAAKQLTGELPVVLGDSTNLNIEKITALKPDLILAIYSGLTEEQYGVLSGIAPTIAQAKDFGDYGVSWQTVTRTVGTAIGKATEADALVTKTEEQTAALIAKYPQFAGKTAVVVTPYQGIFVYGRDDARGRLLTTLGMQMPAELVEMVGTSFGANLSNERADLLDVDVIIWLDADPKNPELGGPLYPGLKVRTEGREVFLSSSGSALGGATSFVSVLSLPYLLEQLTPMLAAALDGDPATLVPAASAE